MSRAKFRVFDGHNDTLLNLYSKARGKGRSFFEESDIGHIDLPRARKGGFMGGFFAIFVPTPPASEVPVNISEEQLVNLFLDAGPTPVDHQTALAHTLAMARLMQDLERASNGAVRKVCDVSSLRACIDEDILAMIFHIEGAEAIDPELNALHVLFEAGLRSIGIVWSRPNAFGFGVPFSFPGPPDTGPGLTDAGVELVRTCNKKGILIDLSHLNEQGFWEVQRLSDRPLVATHSGVHTLCPSPRNLTDRQIDAIRESGGLIGVNFHVGFLREDGARNVDTSLDILVRHINYIADRAGIEHVAFGSDFDGALMPAALGDVAGLPRLMAALETGGHDEDSLQKIGYQNWIRILEATWID